MTTIDLHGIEGQPFPGFDEETTYLERVTIPELGKAIQRIAGEWGLGYDEINPEPIFMRYVVGAEALDWSDGEFPECWLECEPDHPDASPFWRDSP